MAIPKNLLASILNKERVSNSESSAEAALAYDTSCPSPLSSDLQELPEIWLPLRREARLVRQQYRHLYKLPVTEHADGSRSFHDGRLYRCSGLNVLLLRGDPVEMAFQHGRLLADQIRLGALSGAARLIDNSIANTWGTPGRIGSWLIEKCQGVLHRWTLESARRRMRSASIGAATFPALAALADASGISAAGMIRALFNPELLLVLAKWGVGPSPVNCCSSFAAWGSYTRDGSQIIGRNMDYPLNGFYDLFPTVIYYEPAGTALPHMSFASAGVHNAGITSYNAAGLFLASHVIPSRDMSLEGVPALLTADLAAGECSTLDRAARRLGAIPSPAGWSYFLADTKERKVSSLEKSHCRCAMRSAEGECHIQTNRYLTPTLRAENLYINASIDEDSEARATRIRQRLESARGRLDAIEALSILGDQFDPVSSQVRGLGNTVGMHATLTSVVIDPARERALVSTGPGPACHGEFVELPLIGTFDFDDFGATLRRTHRNTSFPDAHPEKFKAQQIFIRAKQAYEYDNDPAKAFRLLRQVILWDSTNPAYFFQLGIFALKNHDFPEALETFGEGLHCLRITPHLKRLCHYYRGRALAHLSRAQEAQVDFSAVADDPAADAKLRSAARRAAWRTKLFGRLRLGKRSLNIMMQQSDMLAY